MVVLPWFRDLVPGGSLSPMGWDSQASVSTWSPTFLQSALGCFLCWCPWSWTGTVVLERDKVPEHTGPSPLPSALDLSPCTVDLTPLACLVMSPGSSSGLSQSSRSFPFR